MFNAFMRNDMAKNRTKLTPLADETRSALPTAEAAAHLSRSPQTLRFWSARGIGPILPLTVHGRLAWPVSEIRRVLAIQEPARGGAQ